LNFAYYNFCRTDKILRGTTALETSSTEHLSGVEAVTGVSFIYLHGEGLMPFIPGLLLFAMLGWYVYLAVFLSGGLT
jgi:hypothetical protein